MAQNQKTSDEIRTLIETVRSSAESKGRVYGDGSCDPEWLAKEVAGFCGTQGWSATLLQCPDGSSSHLVFLDQGIAALIERSGTECSVRVLDIRPEKVKTQLALGGALALTGLGIIGLPAMGFSVWSHAKRKKIVGQLMDYIDERATTAPLNRVMHAVARDVPSRLRELEKLKEEGLLTESEYLEKRRDVIADL